MAYPRRRKTRQCQERFITVYSERCMSALGPKFLKVAEHVDDRGRLRIFEVDHTLPFVPLRSFVISNVQRGKTRAGHILSCDQILAMLQGACRLTVQSGTNKVEYHFTAQDGAIYLQQIGRAHV